MQIASIMVSSAFFPVVMALSLLVFAVPDALKYYFTLALIITGMCFSSMWSVEILTGTAQIIEIPVFTPVRGTGFVLLVDTLSAFFIIVINITVLTGFIYAKGYLAPYRLKMSSLRFSIHYFSFLWLWLSMLLVVMLRDGIPFLIAWELMALSSFFLVIFEAENRNILKTGISYLIQMHVGMFFIMAAFLIIHKNSGRMGFDALGEYFSGNRNLPLFLLFFTGFAIKAGFMPLHTWLPEAHPAAPSHVSGVMSGAMIKMGFYGIIRVLAAMQSDLLIVGIIILLISLFSGIMGIMMAIVQKDIKKMLAYSTIENAGIIGVGIGLGAVGQALGNNALVILAYAGSMLHILNHSLFKSLLFFNAGSVYNSIHTRNMEQTGGLIKKMPWTAMIFLTGAMAISGLPPFNGFISEYLIYMGMINSLSSASLYQSIVMLGSVVSLSLIGGLSVFCFTRAFGTVFLGEPRSDAARSAVEVKRSMIVPQLISVTIILFIGLASPLVAKPAFNMVVQIWGTGNMPMFTSAYVVNMSQISLSGGILITALTALLLYRRYHLRHQVIETGPTWGCGYTAVTPSHQYTATSFAYNFNHIAKPVLQTRKEIEQIEENEIFPGKRVFKMHSDDLFRRNLIVRPVNRVAGLLKQIAVMQTGQIRHYVMYAFLFMLLILLLTMFNII